MQPFYLTDIAELNAAETSSLRRNVLNKEIKLVVVVKNTPFQKALEIEKILSELIRYLKGTHQ
jgi:ribosomal protein L10